MAADKSELRQLAPTNLLQALDAIAMAKGLDRHSYIEAVLMAEVVKVGHEAMVIARCLHGNPIVSDGKGANQ